MTLYDLILTSSWASVEIILLELYPEEQNQLEDYKQVYKKLQHVIPIPSKSPLILKELKDDSLPDTDETYVEIFCPMPEGEDEPFAMEFAPWAEWLGKPIAKENLENFSVFENIAHCLCEMTFISFDEKDINNSFARLMKSYEQAQYLLDNPDKANFLPVDEYFKKWDNM